MHAQVKQYYDKLIEQGFRPRKAQQDMIDLIDDAFSQASEEKVPYVAIEAGTGTGKTFGYLLPLIPIAQANGKQVIVSTGTIALQEQLVNQDIPQLQVVTGMGFTYALAKGRRNYACTNKVIAEMSITNSTHSVSLNKIKQVEGWDGDFDSLPFTLPIEDRLGLSTDSAGCSNRKCANYDNCAVMRARNKLSEVDVVIANHAMLISDLMIDEGGVFLPKHTECYHVIDEAHHLPKEVTDRASNYHQVKGAADWLNQLLVNLSKDHKVDFLNKMAKHLSNTIVEQTNSAINELYRIFQWIIDSGIMTSEKAQKEKRARFVKGEVPHELSILGRHLNDDLIFIEENVRLAQETLKDAIRNAQDLTPDVVTFQTALAFYRQRLQNALHTWKLMLEVRDSSKTAKWIAMKFDKATGTEDDYEIHAGEIDAGEFLNNKLWNQTAGAVLTSATITAFNKFNYFLEEVGLSHLKPNTLRLMSPFDYKTRAIIEVPTICDPTQSQQHMREVTKWCKENIEPNTGVLILCTSNSQLKELARDLTDRFHCLVQNDAPRAVLIEKHMQLIDEGTGSVLIGLDTFGEGLNLPGDYCTHVIITKLPFGVPTNPVEEAKAELVEANGGNPFKDISLPVASRKLIQWVGRLLRTEEDYGRVTILDARLKTKAYGKQLLDAMPPMTRILS